MSDLTRLALVAAMVWVVAMPDVSDWLLFLFVMLFMLTF
jgi:hypothetical protein